MRTLAILRTCGQAAFWGPIAGVSDDECDPLVTGADPEWSVDERALIAVGFYRTVCTLCNALDLPMEGWMRAWPGSAG